MSAGSARRSRASPAARFGWQVDPERVRLVADVMSGVAELLRALVRAGRRGRRQPAGLPAVLPASPARSGAASSRFRSSDAEAGWRLDLDGLEQAFAGGARAYLLCHPHNPTGTSVPARAARGASPRSRATHGVVVIADEVHAPMTMAGASTCPFLSLGDAAAEHGLAIVSRVEGLEPRRAEVRADRHRLRCGCTSGSRRASPGSPGVPRRATSACSRPSPRSSTAASGWTRSSATSSGTGARSRCSSRSTCPAVGYGPPEAGYLAWLDCRALDLGDDPAEVFLERGRVALSPGPTVRRAGARLRPAELRHLLGAARGGRPADGVREST